MSAVDTAFTEMEKPLRRCSVTEWEHKGRYPYHISATLVEAVCWRKSPHIHGADDREPAGYGGGL